MDRRLIAGALGLLLAGCAMARSGMPAGARPAPVEVGEVDALPPIGDAVAQTYAQRDAATHRAGQSPESPPFDDPPPPSASLPPGRPAPFADRTTGSPRLQAPPASGRPEDRPADPRPAPFADRPPAGPRPQSSSPEPAPAAAPSAPSEPTTDPVAGPPPSPFAASASAPAKEPTSDPQVRAASAPATPSESPGVKGVPAAANGKAATVGTEVITVRQVYAAMIEKRDKIDPQQWSNPAFKKQVFASTLNGLIDRALLVQAAKKRIKEIKQFNVGVDKEWVDHELPPLLREYKVTNIHELKRELSAKGRSLEQMREDYRLSILAHEFLFTQLKDKLHVDFPEMYDYYNKNKSKYHRPAQIVWHEIEVDIAKCPSRADARARADTILDRLGKGDDFARLASTASHGATAKEGGRWVTAPGGSASSDINAALAGLAPGQTSAVIEVPGSFHIVRLESRRDAGIAPFPEVQDQIKEAIFSEKRTKSIESVIATLRAKTVITTLFDNPNFDPSAVRTGTGPATPTRR